MDKEDIFCRMKVMMVYDGNNKERMKLMTQKEEGDKEARSLER